MRAITRQRYTRFLHIAKHGTKTGKGLSQHGFFPSEVSNNMLCDLGRMSRGSALDERKAAHCHRAHGTQDQHDTLHEGEPHLGGERGLSGKLPRLRADDQMRSGGCPAPWAVATFTVYRSLSRD